MIERGAPSCRSERCLCGDAITSVDLPAFIAEAVRRHNQQRRHRLWRQRRERVENPVPSVVRLAAGSLA